MRTDTREKAPKRSLRHFKSQRGNNPRNRFKRVYDALRASGGINSVAYQKCRNIIPHLVLPHPPRMKDKEFYLISTTKTQEKNGVLYKKSSPKARNTNK